MSLIKNLMKDLIGVINNKLFFIFYIIDYFKNDYNDDK